MNASGPRPPGNRALAVGGMAVAAFAVAVALFATGVLGPGGSATAIPSTSVNGGPGAPSPSPSPSAAAVAVGRHSGSSTRWTSPGSRPPGPARSS